MENNNVVHDSAVEHFLAEVHDTLVIEVENYLRIQGMNQTQFARQIGVTKGYISQFLNGRSDHKLSKLISISLAIGKLPHFVLADIPRAAYSLPERKGMTVEDRSKEYGTPDFLQNAKLNDETEAFKAIDKVKKQIDGLRPFPTHVQHMIMQKFRYAWNYHSNAIEGNKLTYGETISLIMNGLTAKGKPLKDHLDVKGHEDALDMMLDMIKGERDVSQNDVRQLHRLLLKESYQQSFLGPDNQRMFRTIHVGEYKRQPNHVLTADKRVHYYAPPGEVPIRMSALLKWYNEVKDSTDYHPIVVAAIFHHEFVAIHPFDDGNGRMGRILMNFTLMRHGFPPIVIEQQTRMDYYDALSKADSKDFTVLIDYLSSGLKRSLDIQLDGLTNGNIQPYRWEETE